MSLIFFSALFVFLSYLNPLFSIIFSIGIIGEKIFQNGNYKKYFIGIFAFSLLFLITKLINIVDFFEIMIAGGINYFYVNSILSGKSYSQTIINSIGLLAVVTSIQMLVFRAYYSSIINQSTLIIEEIFGQSKNMEMMVKSMDIVKSIYQNNYVAIYTLIIGFAIYIGTIMLSRKKEMKIWNHKLFELPDFFTYILIISLGFIIFRVPNLQKIGINLLLILLFFYFIQGVSVILFLFRNILKKSKFYYALLVFLLILNNLFFIIFSLLGIFDRWFDFRKLHKKKLV